jgi:nicotinamidase-related amidase
MRILKDNCSGLVIDLQNRLFPVVAEKELLLANCQKLILGLALLGIPTMATQQYSKGLGDTLEEIKNLTGSFEFIEKSSFSCLDEPLFEAYLAKSGRSTVLICGIESHVCVLQSAIDLQEKGYFPIVISDCISSRNLGEKLIALQRLALEGIRVSTVESILFELTRSASAPEFRAISKLIK